MKKIFLVLVPLVIIAGFFTSCSRDEPSLTGPPPVVIVPVIINEVYTQGVITNPDWVEIYNPNNDSINIGNYKVYNVTGKNGSIGKKIIPPSTYIRGKSHLVIVVNDTVSTTGFNLSTTGETIWFENGSGIVIDSVVIPVLGVDSSYARKPDGASTWSTVTPPTNGQPNSILPIVMNEIFSRGVPGDADWIEMYNPNATPIDISTYKVYDAGGQVGSKPKKEIPAGTIIPGNGFYVITVDTTDVSGFGLSSAGETAWLENANGNIIDNVIFPAMPVATTSYGRIPNGSSTWQIMNTISKSSSNVP